MITAALATLAFMLGAVWGRATDRDYRRGFRDAHRICHRGRCTSWCRAKRLEGAE